MGLTIDIRVKGSTEASYMVKWQCKETDYIVGCEDMSDVILDFEEKIVERTSQVQYQNNKKKLISL